MDYFSNIKEECQNLWSKMFLDQEGGKYKNKKKKKKKT